MKPMDEWDHHQIFLEYQEAKQKTLHQQEEDIKFLFTEYKGDEDKMNQYLLTLIQGVQVNINRIYFRMEDPEYPYAFGILLPSISVTTTDKGWNQVEQVVENSETMFKTIQIKDFQVFLARNHILSRVDKIMKLDQIKDVLNFSDQLEWRIQEHIENVFKGQDIGGLILKKFHIDVKFQMILDKARVLEKEDGKNEPDIKLQILFGGLFNPLTQCNFLHQMSLKLKENQIMAGIQFFNYTGFFNTFRLGVLKPILDKLFDPNSPDLQEYMELYYQYLKKRNKHHNEEFELLKSRLIDIEARYRTDIIFMLRKLINERYFGLKYAKNYRKEQLRKLETATQRLQTRSFFSRIPFFGRSEQNIQDDILVQDKEGRLSEEQHQALRKIGLGFALIKLMYNNRYKQSLIELEKFSKVLRDPDFQCDKPKENSILVIDFCMPMANFKIYSDEHSKLNKVQPYFHSVFEGLDIKLRSETNPEYLGLYVAFNNFFIKDHYAPQPSLPYVLQTVMLDFMTQSRQGKRCFELTYEIFPKGQDVATKRLKLNTYAQVYIYANLGFATTIIRLITKSLAELNNNFAQLIEEAPERIRQDLNRGSFYSEMLKKVIAKKQDELYQNLYDYAYGNYELPNFDLDINFISPKIILHESLINEKLMDPNHTAAIIIDLGTIDACTNLLKKEKTYDYQNSNEVEKLYDITYVKFGKLRISLDYRLRLLNKVVSDRVPCWEVSKDIIQLTNEFNFGFEFKTCLTPFHQIFPATVLNFRVQELKLNLSQRTIATLYKYYNLFFSGKFMRALNLFISAPPPKPPYVIEMEQDKEKFEEENMGSQEIIEQAEKYEKEQQKLKKQQEKFANETLLQSIKRIVVETAIEEIKEQYKSEKYDEAKKAINIQLNFIFSKMTVIMSEVDEKFTQNNYDSNLVKHEYHDSKISMFSIQERIEFGLTQIKARIDFIPKTSLKYQLFMKRIYIQDIDNSSESEYKFLILNPLTEAEYFEGNASISRINFQSVERGISLYQTQPVSLITSKYMGLENQSRMNMSRINPLNKDIQVEFLDFAKFDPTTETIQANNQLIVTYEEQGNLQLMDVTFSNLRVVFIVPLVSYIFKLYCDLKVDFYIIPKLVEEHLKGNRTIPLKNAFERFGGMQKQQTSFVGLNNKTQLQSGDNNSKNQNELKRFTVNKKFTIQEERKELNPEEEKGGGKFSGLVSLAKHTSKIEDKHHDKEADVPDEDLLYEERSIILKMHIQCSTIEVLIPTNIYSKKQLTLKMSTKFQGNVKRKTHYRDAFLRDRWKTWKGSTIEVDHQHLDSKLLHLQIYVESSDDYDQSNITRVNEKIYFLHPYDLKWKMRTSAVRFNDMESCYKSDITYQGKQDLLFTIGLKELNAYLILGQLTLSFLNEIADMQKKMTNTMNVAVHKDANSYVNIEGQLGVRANMPGLQHKAFDLEDILRNERLIKVDEERIKKTWKKGYIKALDSIKKKTFFEFVSKFKFKGIKLHFIDNTSMYESLALLTISLKDVYNRLENRGFEALNNYRMENLFQIEKLDLEDDYSFYHLETRVSIDGSYYNKLNYSEEPFIETFPFFIKMQQRTPLSHVDQIFHSDEMLNFNFSYGLALNIQTIIRALLNQEKEEELKMLPQTSLQLHLLQTRHSLNFFPDNNAISQNQYFQQQSKNNYQLSYNTRFKYNHDEVPDEYVNPESESGSSENNESIITTHTFFHDVVDLEFINKTGLDVKFCLNVFDICLRPSSQPQNYNSNIKLLPYKHKMIVPIIELKSALQELQMEGIDNGRSTIKFSFMVTGYKKVKNITIQRNGIFGYYLQKENKKKRHFLTGKLSSKFACIVRINREEQKVKIFFESNLLLFNDSCLDIVLCANEHHTRSDFIVQQKDVFNVPLPWIRNKVSLGINKNTLEVPIQEQVFHNIQEVFDPRVMKPYNNYAKVVFLHDKYIAIDIFYLETKTNVGQFLVIFQPVLTLSNFLFTEINLFDMKAIERRMITKIHTKTLKSIYQINPYLEARCSFLLQYKANENEIYEKFMHFDLSKIKRHKNMNLHKGFFVDLYNIDKIDHTKPRVVQIAFEKQKHVIGLKETKYDNFSLRKLIYDRTKSIYFKIYAPFIAVNRTSLCLNLIGLEIPMMINPYSNVLIAPDSTKMKVQIEGFKESQSFLVNTFGVSGTVRIPKLKQQSKSNGTPQNFENPIDPSLDPNQKTIELGTYIGMCPHPYSSTKIIKFQPRYRIVNKLDLPIVIKENNCTHQIGIRQGEELSFNLSDSGDDLLRVRLLNLEQEAKIIYRDTNRSMRLKKHSEPIKDINKITSLKSNIENPVVLERNISYPFFYSEREDQILSRRDVSVCDEYMMNDSAISDIERYMEINDAFGYSKDRSIWSYKFPISTIDDFQLSLININPLPDKDFGWSITERKFFVRVNIAPGQDDDATLFVTFTHPKSQQKLVICLNPVSKDEDFLVISLVNEFNQIKHKFIYEIDSLFKDILIGTNNVALSQLQSLQYYLVTNLSGNLRFIHFMNLEQYKKFEKQKYRKFLKRLWSRQQNVQQFERLDEKANNNFEDHMRFQALYSSPSKSMTASMSLKGTQQIFKRKSEVGEDLNISHSKAYSFFNNIGGDESAEGTNLQKTLMKISFKGIGISLIDHQPREICYISIYEPEIIQFIKYSLNKQGVEKTRRKLEFKVGNIQIDNMTMRSFPVIFGPKKAFNHQESKQLFQSLIGVHRAKLRLENESIPVENPEITRLKQKQSHKYFIFFYMDHQITSEKKITCQRVKNFELGLAQLSINFHQYFLNHLIQFASSLSQFISNEDMAQFMNSKTMKNYNHLIEIMNKKPNHQIHQDGKQSMATLQERFGALPPEDQNSQLYRRSRTTQIELKFQTKEEICPPIKADPVQHSDNQGFVQRKILIQNIEIKAMRIFLTFRIQKIDNPGNEGMATSLINFFTNFANVSDAQIYFSDLFIKNAYSTIEDVKSRLVKHYIKQGIQQFYEVLGATDIIGNPMGLINNLGRGVEEFYSEPFEGALTGDPSKAAIGVGKGFKGLAANTTVAITNSLSKMSGTWYVSLRNLTGRTISESNLENPHSIPSGIYYGSVGLVKEFGYGVTGIVTTPYKRAREEGKGVITITKGTVQGVLGFVLTPINGLCRFVHSVTTGVMNFALGDMDYSNQRFRYPRYFDEQEVMRPYDSTRSHAFAAIHKCENGLYKDQDILMSFDVSSYADIEQTRFKAKVLICTEEEIIYIQDLYKIKAHFLYKDLQDVYLNIQGKVNKKTSVLYRKIVITFMLKNGKTKEIRTGKLIESKLFQEYAMSKILNFEHRRQQRKRSIITYEQIQSPLPQSLALLNQ